LNREPANAFTLSMASAQNLPTTSDCAGAPGMHGSEIVSAEQGDRKLGAANPPLLLLTSAQRGSSPIRRSILGHWA